ncbi:MAG: class I tRNA ligase family protein [Candidatus Pacebacteria bacterium]|nr:class I tRNA ligase family protein [Candidatus Paceibacterota bacterium]
MNTAISDMMKLANFLDKEKEINKNDYIDFLKILSPFAPHITDELFEKVSNNNFLLIQS